MPFCDTVNAIAHLFQQWLMVWYELLRIPYPNAAGMIGSFMGCNITQ